MIKRYCSVPRIPYVRPWIEERFGDICRDHDEAYGAGKCRVCRDIKFFGVALGRCLFEVFFYSVSLILLPVVFIGFQINSLVWYINGKSNGK